MKHQKCYKTIALIILCLCLAGSVFSRALYNIEDNPSFRFSPKPSAEFSNRTFEVHDIGRLSMTITNFGTFGTGYLSGAIGPDGEIAPSAEYPINSNLSYLFVGTLWIGAVIGRDTLVSIGNDGWAEYTPEFAPDAGDDGAIIRRSNIASKPDYSIDAISEQDFICFFTDTNIVEAGMDRNDNRPHIPLYVAVQQSSYAWSYEYAEDFILFDYKISNIGIYPIKEMYLALYIDADVHHTSVTSRPLSSGDDICGFRRTVAMAPGYGFDEDTVNIAWIADNDGDPTGGAFDSKSPIAATGTRVVRSPSEDLQYSFNWWISNDDASSDFGPRKAGTDEDPFRNFGGAHIGTPTGDRNKYYVMSHPEFDYDQLYCAIPHMDEGFLPPPRPDLASGFADGYDTRYLLSFGPFDVEPGDTLPVTIAYLAGDNMHTSPSNFTDFFDATKPDSFYNKLNFTDFGENARWASWVFDNPGYSTNENEDSGRYNWVCPDTTFKEGDEPPESLLVKCKKMYYRGDGVPDFRGASPPPAPEIKVITELGKATIRWNGERSENAVDIFSGKKDFEGYRVYYSLSDVVSDFVLLTSYDVDDYKRFEYNFSLETWEQTSVPFTLDSLRSLYGPDFEPLRYDNEFGHFIDPNTNDFIYFRAQDWNQSDLSDPYLIHRVYPNASKDDPSDTTNEGWRRYYEYEYVIDNLQPSVPYHFSVTAFDYGSLKVELGALESSILVNAIEDFPLPSGDVVEDKGLKVIVYPNPYRKDGGYAEAGYENRNRELAGDRMRAINFANLPNVCTIRIYSIDGDLIRQIEHNYPEGGPGSQHEVWNLISRNTQAVVTGLYLWHVESAMGEQLGKLVIMK